MENPETKELAIVDEKLEEALAPITNTYSEISITKELFKKYCVPGATEAEIFFCMGKTRALGLDPLMPGYVHYIKFPGKPYDLFVGYPEYLKQAYASGLEHLSYEFTEDDTGELISVITTLDIKGREKPFVWETWYAEVVGETGGKVNWRWQKAPRSQLRKCGGVDAIRYSGLLTVNLPYIPEEMSGESVAQGYRTIPQSMLDAHGVEPEEAEITVGEVNADYHKPIDEWRKAYHATWKDEEIFADDEERHAWELAIFGKPSSADFEIIEYRAAFKEFDSGRAAIWVQEYRNSQLASAQESKPIEEQIADKAERLEAEAAERMAEEKAMQKGGDLNLDGLPGVPKEHLGLEGDPEKGNDQPVSETQAEAQQEQDDTTQGDLVLITDQTVQEINETLLKLKDTKILKTIKSAAFHDFAVDAMEHPYSGIRDILDSDGILILNALKARLNAEGQVEAGEIQEASVDLSSGQLTLEELADEYQRRIYNRFASVEDLIRFQEDNTGLGSFRDFQRNHLVLALGALDEMDLGDAQEAKAKANAQPATSQKPAEADGTCTDEEYKEFGALFTELIPGKQYAMGSTEARDLIRESKAVKGVFTTIKNLTTEERSDLKHFLEDKLSDSKAEPKTA